MNTINNKLELDNGNGFVYETNVTFNIKRLKDILDESIINPTKRVAICVTTNGVVKQNGDLVMGAGVAKQFANKFKGIQQVLGLKVMQHGNHVYHVGTFKTNKGGYEYDVLSFPTKKSYTDNADIELIKQSARRLVKWANQSGANEIFIPSPGTGLGKLTYNEVYTALDGILDDRFTVVQR